MKRTKRLQILAGALVVAALATFGVLHYQERQEEIANTDEIILSVDADSVTALSWSVDDAVVERGRRGFFLPERRRQLDV